MQGWTPKAAVPESRRTGGYMYDTKYAVGDFVDLARLIGYRRAIFLVFDCLDDETMGRVVEALEDEYASASTIVAGPGDDRRYSGVLEP